MADRVFTATTTENAEALSGALENRFDAVALQKELDTQREVSQAFSQNVQSAKAELNRAADRLTADYEAGRISQAEYDAKRQQLDNGALLLSTIAAGLSAPTNSALGIATATLSPSVAKEIGQYFKSTNKEGTTEHLIAHGLLAAAVAATGGNNALSAAGAAMSAEAAAPVLAHYLYGKAATELNADEKATISSITSLVGAGVGATTGTDSSIAQGAESAGTAVDNNALSRSDRKDLVQAIIDCGGGSASACQQQADLLTKSRENDQEVLRLIQKMLDEEALSPAEDLTFRLLWEGAITQAIPGESIPELAARGVTPEQQEAIRKALYQTDKTIPSAYYVAANSIATYEPGLMETIFLPITADFTPVIGDIKGFVEAETIGDYVFASLGVIPLAGDALKALHKAEKSYEAAKEARHVGEMTRAIEQANELVRLNGYNLSPSWFPDGKAHWINPVTNAFEEIPANAKVTVDHILPRNYIMEEVEGFKALPKKIQDELMNAPENLQPMVKSANCSKGCKVEFVNGGWKTWKDEAVHPEYKEYLFDVQRDIEKRVNDYIKTINLRK